MGEESREQKALEGGTRYSWLEKKSLDGSDLGNNIKHTKYIEFDVCSMVHK